MTTATIRSPRVVPQEILRASLRLCCIGLSLVMLLPLHACSRMLRRPSPWAALFFRIASSAMGMKVRAHGKPLHRNVLFVANHVSWHDVLVLGGLTGSAFVAQDGVRKWPICGWLATLNGTVFVSRTAKQSVAAQIDALRTAMIENTAVALFPEGTTSDGRGLLPFKPSLFAALTPAPKPILIQPVLLDFGSVGPEIAWLGEETGGESAWRAFTRRGQFRVDVHFLRPFDPRSLPDRKAICEEARRRISGAQLECRAGHAALSRPNE